MTPDELKKRTKQFGLNVIRCVNGLPNRPDAIIIGKQLLRSATSVGANYRAACRGRSKADFVAKLGVAEEEADECVYWMELLVEAGIIERNSLAELLTEADELTAIISASRITAKNNR